jgi:hypothetical protein
MGLARMFAGIIAFTALTACSGGDEDRAWVAITEAQPSALLGVWGASEQDVWAVGGRDGSGPLVFHYDGAGWTRVATGLQNVDLWWVHGFAGGPVYMSGSNGTILRYDGSSFTTMATPGTGIVFGMWGAAADDMWAVGGSFNGGGFIWRYDGTAWTEVADAPADIAVDGSFWKVNGLASNDVWISCSKGATLHWNGSGFERLDLPVTDSMFSVAGNAERYITVGGSFDGKLFENEGSGWQSAIPTGGPILTGVAVSANDAYAVGQFGTILRRGGNGTWAVEKTRATDQNLHAAWIDPSGGAWVVGGHFDPPMRDGVLVYKGEPLQGSIP